MNKITYQEMLDKLYDNLCFNADGILQTYYMALSKVISPEAYTLDELKECLKQYSHLSAWYNGSPITIYSIDDTGFVCYTDSENSWCYAQYEDNKFYPIVNEVLECGNQ